MKTPDELMFLKNKNALQHESEVSMRGKTCVITGATSGVGLEAARALAKGQASIVMVVRSLAKGEEVKKELVDRFGISVDIVVADFSLLDDVRNAAKQVLALTNKIDVLINCAGLHSTKATYTPEGFETVFCVNHLASFLFTELLLDRLKESAPSRILQINSEGHRFNGLDITDLDWKRRHYTGLRGYGASKTAQLLTVWEINDRLKNTGVTINAMHPGDVKTHIGSNNGFLYRLFSKLVIQPSLRSPVISGKAIYYLVADPILQDVSGKFYHLTIEETPAKHALDRSMGKRIYEESQRLTGLSKHG